MLPAHERAVEASRYAATESVRLARLDRIGREYLAGINRPFLKIDTQGYETVYWLARPDPGLLRGHRVGALAGAALRGASCSTM